MSSIPNQVVKTGPNWPVGPVEPGTGPASGPISAQNRYCRGNRKKIYYDPIDYESIDDIDFWVNEEAPPELDINEIENLLYHEDAIPIVESSLRNNQDDDEFGTMPFQVEEDNDVEVNLGGSNGEDAFIPSVIFDYGETSFDEYNDV
ncbi:hypothetical protein QL285_062213 [Trifolium repens]|nr:hypothetical protein QL285_062213 [Trifolium repens]